MLNNELENTLLALKDKFGLEAFHNYCILILNEDLPEDWEVPQFHWDIYADFRGDEKHKVLYAPVGFSKSTIAKIWACYELIAGRSRFCLYTCSTEAQAITQFEVISKILNDSLIGFMFGFKIVKMNNTEVVIRFAQTGLKRKIQMIWAGARNILSINYESIRPDTIICDDIQDKREANSQTLTLKLVEWLQDVLMTRFKGLSYGKFRMIMTNLGIYSLANFIKENKALPTGERPFADFIVKNYQALKDGKSIWEAIHSTESLLNERKIRPTAFERNYMNEPMLNEKGNIKSNCIGTYDWSLAMSTGVFPEQIVEIVGRIDPASSLKTTADDFVLSIFGRSDQNKFFCLDIVCGHFLAKEQGDIVVEMWKKWNVNCPIKDVKLSKIGLESNAYQRTLKEWIDQSAREQGVFPVIVMQNTSKSKEKRLEELTESVLPVFTYHLEGKYQMVNLPAGHEHYYKAESQLLAFPDDDHDDIADTFFACIKDLMPNRDEIETKSSTVTLTRPERNISIYGSSSLKRTIY